jgi:hypothetical protein
LRARPELFEPSERAWATSAQELAMLVGGLVGLVVGGLLTGLAAWAPFALAALLVPALAAPTVFRAIIGLGPGPDLVWAALDPHTRNYATSTASAGHSSRRTSTRSGTGDRAQALDPVRTACCAQGSQDGCRARARGARAAVSPTTVRGRQLERPARRANARASGGPAPLAAVARDRHDGG